MKWEPGDPHEPAAWRARDGWQRWHADCPCGWMWTGVGGKEDAERAAARHERGDLTHTCYSPQEMEYDPGPCAACLAEAVDPPSAAAEIGEYLAKQPLTDEEIFERDKHDSYRRRRP